MPHDPELSAHLEWLGYIQPVGLVVSPPALVQAQAHINRNVIPQHQRFLACLPMDANDEPIAVIQDFPQLVREVLDWQDSDLIAFEQAARSGHDVAGLEVVLPEYNETLRPTWIVPEFIPKHAAGNEPPSGTNAGRWVLLIQQIADSQDLDEPLEESDRRWHASPHARFERLLRETQVPAGLLTNGRQLRLVYAPRGETSGYLTFDVAAMITVAGRPIFAALHMLLNADRLFNLEKSQRLPAILVESRKYQNTVSTQLAQQVMAALYELLRGFQAADDQWNGRLLQDVLATNPQHVYHGLLTVLMRTVFVLYAEDRNLLSSHPVYTNYYAIIGLFERLRSDAGQYPDTMDQRYGAWAQLLSLFRMIYEGGSHAELQIPPRKGYLFDPSRYPFLEGRGLGPVGLGPVGLGSRAEETASVPTPRSPTTDPRPPIPRVSDGVVYRVLNNLLILDGERLSYRSLDVEQIGSVYEAIMGFEVRVSTGRSIAIRPIKKHGAPATINLEELLGQKAAERAKWLKEHTDQELGGKALDALKSAMSIEELLAALESKISGEVTPNIVPAGAMIFQPSDERRRSGSHYTPRSLTEPIVRTALEPILKQLAQSPREGETGEAHTEPQPWSPTAANKKRFTAAEIEERIRLSRLAIEHSRLARDKGFPHPSQILDLKICDPAMGSGAFLVETCRQLGDELIKAWAIHADSLTPDPRTLIPPDEDEVLYARRLIAQRCLYGVDKNIMAVDLAKLSLWLVTLAKAHPFTFLDHSLRYGDSLVGLTREQIIGFHWEPGKHQRLGADFIQKRLDRATEARAKILNAREDVPYRDQEQRLAVADEALNVIRLTGDACLSTFFAGTKKKDREDRCKELFVRVSDWYTSGHDIKYRGIIAAAAESLRTCEHPIPPFHWEIEFPEVFSRENGGFDCFVGNPPFIGGTRISTRNGKKFVDFIIDAFNHMGNRTDLVAYFFRQCFAHLRQGGTFGLIATQTIAQGDTRVGGLAYIRSHGGSIYSARTRVEWPGVAAVIISVLHIAKGTATISCNLNGREVEKITSYLFHTGSDAMPEILKCNSAVSFSGVYPYGTGFQFADDDPAATPLCRMEEITSIDPRYKQLLHAYIGGKEILNDPKQAHSRYVINFREMDYQEAELWPLFLDILREKVKPERESKGGAVADWPWWRFWRPREAMLTALKSLDRYLAHPFTTSHLAFAFLPSSTVVAAPHIAILLDSHAAFGLLQSRVHEVWTRFFSSTLKDDLRYSFSDCFDNFAFPENWQTSEKLLEAGRRYYHDRMVFTTKENDGLTSTYNRFHDPHEQSPDILHLRDLHAAMDRAVLEAYGWHDLATTARCEFLLDYEEEDDETGGKPSKKKKPWRLRWPDEFRDEVLARLLELNEQRHKEEVLAGKAVSGRRVSSGGDEGDDEAESLDDTEDNTEPTPKQTAAKKTAKPKSPRKSQKSPAAGQQEMEFEA